MSMRCFRPIALGTILAAYGPTFAATIIVPDDNPSVRDAVRNAAPGDTSTDSDRAPTPRASRSTIARSGSRSRDWVADPCWHRPPAMTACG